MMSFNCCLQLVEGDQIALIIRFDPKPTNYNTTLHTFIFIKKCQDLLHGPCLELDAAAAAAVTKRDDLLKENSQQ